MPHYNCLRSIDFINRFMKMTKEERAARNLKAVEDALYHVYWCGNASCEAMWASLMKNVESEPSKDRITDEELQHIMKGIHDEELQKMIVKIMNKDMPNSIPRPASGIFETEEP